MRRAYKFRLYPNVDQTRELEISLETHRRIYNAALAERKEAWEKERRSVGFYEQDRRFRSIRNAELADEKAGGSGPHWYAHVGGESVRSTLRRLDRAFENFLRRLKGGQKPGYPRFRGRDRYDSIPFDQHPEGGCSLRDSLNHIVAGGMGGEVPLSGHRLRLFGVGNVKVKLHRHIKGKIKTLTVKREADKWYVVFSCDLGVVQVERSKNPDVGVDVGLEHFLTTSDGTHEPNPRYLKRDLPRLRKLSRKIALHHGQKVANREYPKRGSRRRGKNKHLLARLHQRVKNLRREHHHQVACRLVLAYGLIAVECLNIRGMLGNGRLAGAIADAAWGGFVNVLKSKSERVGVRVVEVNPRGTSQECSGCGVEVRKNLDQRHHECSRCGLSLHRDHNAARVILGRAIEGGPDRASGAKRRTTVQACPEKSCPASGAT